MSLRRTASRSHTISPLPRLLLAGLATVALGAAACGSDDPALSSASSTTTSADPGGDETNGSQTFTEADSGKEARLAVGEEIQVSLETCGGCGYEWRMTETPAAATVESLGSANNPRPTSTQPGEAPIVGAPTDTVFRFRGVAAGTTQVSIGYFPPTGDAAEETFTLTLVVA